MTTPARNTIRSRVDVEATHDNTSQEVIRTTSDKLKLVLIEHIEKVENAKSWQTPLSLLVTIILVFCSADFRQAFTLSADTWRALFLFSLIACAIWFFYAVARSSKSPSIDSIINKIKNSE